MKKVLLTAAAVAALSTSVFAEGMMENQFYLRGDLDGLLFQKVKTNGVKIKHKFGLGIDLGVGYYIMDNVRAELVYNQPFGTHMKGNQAFSYTVNGNATGIDTAAGFIKTTGLATAPSAPVATDLMKGTQRVSHKPTVRALLARVSGDVVDLGAAKIFLTGGLGWAQVKDKTTLTWTGSVYSAAGALKSTGANYNVTSSTKAKNKNNLAWTIGAGAAFDVAEGVHLEAAYSWRDYGKSKSADFTGLDNTTYKASATSFRSHNFTAGVRFDI